MGILKVLAKVVGDSNEKELKRIWPVVDEVEDLEDEMKALSDEELRACTQEFKDRLAGGETLDDILSEAFATAREAIRREVGEFAFPVQMLAGVVLHEGRVAELKTGEGKTHVAALALYLNSLTGEGAHLITVNDYLAKRDAQWYGRALVKHLGVSVGVIQHDASFLVQAEPVSDLQNMEHLLPCSRREAYAADITYGTNNEFGFDYLRDNLVKDLKDKVQRRFYYAIVDEVDNILIDEARTPLIISGQAEESAATYQTFARIAPLLQEGRDFTIEQKSRSVQLNEDGISRVETALGISNIYDASNYQLTRYMENALKANFIFKRDVDYVVKDGGIVIVDEFTGRLMPGRRWSEGLHQSVEAKEGVKIQRESLTLATITFQNLFRMYEKLAGMTGTAETEAEEMHKIYGLDVIVVPTNRPMVRDDHSDVVYKNEKGKFNAVVEEIVEKQKTGQPVLVGTVSIEKSEYLSDLLRRRGIEHEVLNAKQHEREASIVVNAGQLGAVTIATNMAGRGTDIKLGPGVADVGGLHIIGTERHEARRIDNQLRGRSGRQGDPGSSRFFVSFGDDIMRRFAPEWLPGMMSKLGMTEDMPIESGMVSKAIEQAQSKVEGHNFDIRKRLVDYDDVMNRQRQVIYEERGKILEGADLKTNIEDMIAQEIEGLVNSFVGGAGDEEGLAALHNEFLQIFPADRIPSAEEMAEMAEQDLQDELLATAGDIYEERETQFGPEIMRQVERICLLNAIDRLWVYHLTAMEELRHGIGLQGVGGTDPLVAYKREARDMFDQLLGNIRQQVTRTIFKYNVQTAPVQPAAAPRPAAAQAAAAATATQADKGPVGVSASSNGGQAAPEPAQPPAAAVQLPKVERVVAGNLRESRGADADGETAAPARREPVVSGAKVGRNEPCPCGSGIKYKKCHGAAV
jgi:preprotein translocase subunit SecA